MWTKYFCILNLGVRLIQIDLWKKSLLHGSHVVECMLGEMGVAPTQGACSRCGYHDCCWFHSPGFIIHVSAWPKRTFVEYRPIRSRILCWLSRYIWRLKSHFLVPIRQCLEWLDIFNTSRLIWRQGRLGTLGQKVRIDTRMVPSYAGGKRPEKRKHFSVQGVTTKSKWRWTDDAS